MILGKLYHVQIISKEMVVTLNIYSEEYECNLCKDIFLKVRIHNSKQDVLSKISSSF